MTYKKQIKVVLIGFVSVVIFYFFYQKEKIIINENDVKDIESYDLIVSSGQSVLSKLLNLFSLSMKSYTHIGIVVKQDNQIYVLHSTPDGTKDNGIRYDNLQEFIDLSNVNYYRILRLDSLTDKQSLEKSISIAKNYNIPFDYDFNNLDKNKIYCTELVFNIFNQNNLITTKLNLSEPIHPKVFTQMAEFNTIAERKTAHNSVYEK